MRDVDKRAYGFVVFVFTYYSTNVNALAYVHRLSWLFGDSLYFDEHAVVVAIVQYFFFCGRAVNEDVCLLLTTINNTISRKIFVSIRVGIKISYFLLLLLLLLLSN